MTTQDEAALEQSERLIEDAHGFIAPPTPDESNTERRLCEAYKIAEFFRAIGHVATLGQNDAPLARETTWVIRKFCDRIDEHAREWQVLWNAIGAEKEDKDEF